MGKSPSQWTTLPELVSLSSVRRTPCRTWIIFYLKKNNPLHCQSHCSAHKDNLRAREWHKTQHLKNTTRDSQWSGHVSKLHVEIIAHTKFLFGRGKHENATSNEKTFTKRSCHVRVLDQQTGRTLYFSNGLWTWKAPCAGLQPTRNARTTANKTQNRNTRPIPRPYTFSNDKELSP